MRTYAAICAIIIVVLLFSPLLSIDGKNSNAASGKEDKMTESISETKPEKSSSQTQNPDSQKTFKVLLTKTNKIVTLSEKDYICGAVAAEMPAAYHSEALKAQAVTCYTYAYRLRNEQKSNPTASLKGADISDDSQHHQGYLTVDDQKKKWGNDYEQYSKKISDTVDAVLGNVIEYGGEPIIAAFHSISSGKTESAKNIWNQDVPYLQSVISTGDKLSPDYSTMVKLTNAEFKTDAEKLGGVSLGNDPKGWVSDIKTTDSGTVTSIKIGGKSFTGEQVRDAFSLHSPCFKLEYKDGFTFSVSGYGHGVGMSQYGADYMARQGSTWQEIIKHYYTGVQIKNVYA